jgi:NifU-like protein involved in Fe-S cluster formation
VIKIIATIHLFSALVFSSIVLANNEVTQTKVEVSLNIFSLNDYASDTNISDILQPKNIKDPIVYYANAGESTLLNITKNDDIKEDRLTINIKVNDSATKYDINFQLENKSSTSIPGITSYSVGDDLIFTAKIDDASKLIKVVTKVVDENNESQRVMSMLKLSSKLFLKDTSQKYFEVDNFWKSDLRRFRMMNKNIITQQGPFYYLTNTDKNQAIKGVIEFDPIRGLDVITTGDNIGIRNFRLIDNQLAFVVLPGKTVILGRWDRSVALKIKEATFLSNEEVENLKAASK